MERPNHNTPIPRPLHRASPNQSPNQRVRNNPQTNGLSSDWGSDWGSCGAVVEGASNAHSCSLVTQQELFNRRVGLCVGLCLGLRHHPYPTHTDHDPTTGAGGQVTFSRIVVTPHSNLTTPPQALVGKYASVAQAPTRPHTPTPHSNTPQVLVGKYASVAEVLESGDDSCSICQEQMSAPVVLDGCATWQ